MAKGGGRVLAALVVAASTFYLADLIAWYFRKNPTGTVTVHPYTAVPRKDKREEYLFDDPQDRTCVNSLLPHQRMTPCWYLRRHPEIRSDL